MFLKHISDPVEITINLLYIVVKMISLCLIVEQHQSDVECRLTGINKLFQKRNVCFVSCVSLQLLFFPTVLLIPYVSALLSGF